jgi:hypothetical protein
MNPDRLATICARISATAGQEPQMTSTDNKRAADPKPSSGELDENALFYHRYPRPGKLEIQATKPLGNQRDLALAYSPGVAAPCLADSRQSGRRRGLYRALQPGRRGLQRHGRARAWQHRSARLQAGDGRQGGAVQEIRRHRRVRHRDRCETSTAWSDVISALEPTFGGINLRTSRRPNASRSNSNCARSWTSRCSMTTSTAPPSSSPPAFSTAWSLPARRSRTPRSSPPAQVLRRWPVSTCWWRSAPNARTSGSRHRWPASIEGREVTMDQWKSSTRRNPQPAS